jgi:rubredoxin
VKQCKYCKQWLDEGEFEIANIINGIRYKRHKCKNCYNTDKSLRRKRIRAQVDELKSSLYCNRCGFDDKRVLVFHHLNPNEKDFTIGDAVHLGYSFERIQEEINKCEVLCANCHLIEHHGIW